jgi:hypothetical protein
MSGVRVLAFALFIVVQAASQDASKMFPYPVPQDGPSTPPVRAQCKFSDGKAITVDYSTRHVKVDPPPYGAAWVTVFDDITFVTGEGLITVKGISLPPGAYTIVPSTNTYPVHNNWTLLMKGQAGGELRVPMSVTKLASPAENSAISFEHTGGSCMMNLNSKNSNTRVSVEFTEKMQICRLQIRAGD